MLCSLSTHADFTASSQQVHKAAFSTQAGRIDYMVWINKAHLEECDFFICISSTFVSSRVEGAPLLGAHKAFIVLQSSGVCPALKSSSCQQVLRNALQEIRDVPRLLFSLLRAACMGSRPTDARNCRWHNACPLHSPAKICDLTVSNGKDLSELSWRGQCIISTKLPRYIILIWFLCIVDTTIHNGTAAGV